VFGDIGTSPLYALHEVFAGPHPIAPAPDHVYGVLSLIVWSLTIIVTLKYVTVIMSANNEGEGGIMALIALVRRAVAVPETRFGLTALGIFGASLFYGDGMITPAISVLSAVEGLKVASPGLASQVVPIALVVLTVLFVIQRFGTGAVGALFGPVMGVWFATLAVVGVAEVAKEPAVLRCLSPTYAVSFVAGDVGLAFLARGSVVLAVTGAEALYADMGHFGRPAIRRAWLVLVFPALILNYLGQGALLLRTPSATDNPFYRLLPTWGQLPMVVLATLATVIASQAVISGAFSVTRQAVQLGFLPRLVIRHTSEREVGQVYVPVVNWALFVAVIGLVVGFGSSSSLASAYGIAVTGTLAIDTVLAFTVFRALWHKPLAAVLAGAGGFLAVDLAFFAGNVTKIPHGGWFPLAAGALVFTVLQTWRRGRELLATRIQEDQIPVRTFINRLVETPPPRVPGTAIYVTTNRTATPQALVENLEHNGVVHEQVILFTPRTAAVPTVPADERVAVTELRRGFVRVEATFGFQDRPDVVAALLHARDRGLQLDVDTASFFVSRATVVTTSAPGLARWRKRLFAALLRNASPVALHYQLPARQVLELGLVVEL
jgi:KUP system potassium uptake protein